MPSETLTQGLKEYRIGEKLKRLRLRKKLGLVQLGEHTGLSPGLLSKLERDQLFPTLPTLLRISLVYGVGLNFFFEETRKHTLAIVKRKERIKLPEKSGKDKDKAAYFFESLDFKALERRSDAYLADFQPSKPGQVELHEHSGIEFIYVLTGRLGLTVAAEEHVLREGDSVYFDSEVLHGYRQVGPTSCTSILVTVP